MVNPHQQKSTGGRALTLIGIAGLLAVIAWIMTGGGNGPRIGSIAPDFQADVMDGEAFTLSDHQGSIVVLDFWATWCPPCRKTLPALQILHQRYERDPDIQIVSVNTDVPKGRGSVLKNFFGRPNNRGLNFPVAFDDEVQSISKAYGVQSIPTLVIIDPEGRIKYVETGAFSSNPEKIAEHLEEKLQAVVDGTPAG